MRTGIALFTILCVAAVFAMNWHAPDTQTDAPSSVTNALTPQPAVSSSAPAPACDGQPSGVRDGAWDVQGVPLRNGSSWVIAATGGEGTPNGTGAANDNGGAGSLIVQRGEEGAFEKLATPGTLYTRFAAGQTSDEQMQIVAASAHGLEWLHVDTTDLRAAAPVNLPAPEHGAFSCENTIPTSVAMVAPGCGEGLLVAVSYYSRNDYWCGGVQLFRLDGTRAEPVRTIATKYGISNVRFFDVDANGKVDLVTSRRTIDRESGAWGDVWLTPHEQCLSDVTAPTRPLEASYLINPGGCALAIADFDVALLKESSADKHGAYFAAGFTAHEFPGAPSCWDAATHGGYAMVTNASGEFLVTPRRLDKYEGVKGPQLMAQAIGFQSQPEPGSVRVATGYFRGSSSTDAQGCLSKEPCPGPALLETFPLAPACEGELSEFTEPPCETWQGFTQRLDVSGLGKETPATASEVSCAAGADGVALPGVNIARVVSVVGGDEASLRKRSMSSDDRATAQGFSFWRGSSWVALEQKIVECVRVDYLVAQSPSVWAANVERKAPQRLTR